jgi:putative transposase
VMNRGNARAEVFHHEADYHAFVRLLRRACARRPMRVLAYCLMPNHFHLALWPATDGALGAWMQWLLTSHVHAYRKQYRSTGHVWQGRFKAFPIQEDDHLLTVLRYIERTPVRAGLVTRAEDWPWSSLGAWTAPEVWPFLDRGPVPRGVDWVGLVNTPLYEGELGRVRHSVNRGTPFGSAGWVGATAGRLGLSSTLRCPGRPRHTAQEPGPGSAWLF